MEFQYIRIILDKVKKKLSEFEKVILISGKECSGKSYILGNLMEFYKRDKTILFLKAVSTPENLEYGVFLTSLSKIGKNKYQPLSIITKLASEKNKIVGMISELLVNYKKNQLKYQLFSFPEIEIDILNRIFSVCKNNELLILADDIDKWDSESRKLLKKLIALQKDVKCCLPSETTILLTASNTDDLHLEPNQ